MCIHRAAGAWYSQNHIVVSVDVYSPSSSDRSQSSARIARCAAPTSNLSGKSLGSQSHGGGRCFRVASIAHPASPCRSPPRHPLRVAAAPAAPARSHRLDLSLLSPPAGAASASVALSDMTIASDQTKHDRKSTEKRPKSDRKATKRSKQCHKRAPSKRPSLSPSS